MPKVQSVRGNTFLWIKRVKTEKMEQTIDRESAGALGGLFQQIIQDMKVSGSLFDRIKLQSNHVTILAALP